VSGYRIDGAACQAQPARRGEASLVAGSPPAELFICGRLLRQPDVPRRTVRGSGPGSLRRALAGVSGPCQGRRRGRVPAPRRAGRRPGCPTRRWCVAKKGEHDRAEFPLRTPAPTAACSGRTRPAVPDRPGVRCVRRRHEDSDAPEGTIRVPGQCLPSQEHVREGFQDRRAVPSEDRACACRLGIDQRDVRDPDSGQGRQPRQGPGTGWCQARRDGVAAAQEEPPAQDLQGGLTGKAVGCVRDEFREPRSSPTCGSPRRPAGRFAGARAVRARHEARRR